MKTINRVQKIQFELMKLASFNEFNGDQVVKDLIKLSHLWHACIMKRDDLISLRDIPDGHYNVDTLFISTTGIDDKKLKNMALKKWGADECEYTNENDSSSDLGQHPAPYKVFQIWWD